MRKLIAGLVACAMLGCGDRKIKPYPVHGTSSSAASASVSSSSSSGGAIDDFSWPEGPGGVRVGQVVPVFFEWDGLLAGESKPSKLYTVDWYDPDGDKDIDAVLVVSAKYDCQACMKEAKELEGRAEFWRDAGLYIKIVSLVINSPTNGPPDVNSAVQWKSMYGLKSVGVGADPDASFATESTFSTPLNTIINPRTMEVIEIKEGYMDSYDTLEQLSYANGT